MTCHSAFKELVSGRGHTASYHFIEFQAKSKAQLLKLIIRIGLAQRFEEQIPFHTNCRHVSSKWTNRLSRSEKTKQCVKDEIPLSDQKCRIYLKFYSDIY